MAPFLGASPQGTKQYLGRAMCCREAAQWLEDDRHNQASKWLFVFNKYDQMGPQWHKTIFHAVNLKRLGFRKKTLQTLSQML